jgi:hypothetical protein
MCKKNGGSRSKIRFDDSVKRVQKIIVEFDDSSKRVQRIVV